MSSINPVEDKAVQAASVLFLSSVISLGQSVEFRTVWALEISNKPGQPDPSKPKIRFVAGIHGNAPVGTAVLLELAAFLCINYGKNSNITRVSFPQVLPLFHNMAPVCF